MEGERGRGREELVACLWVTSTGHGISKKDDSRKERSSRGKREAAEEN